MRATKNQDYVVTGAEAATNVASTGTSNSGAREYSVSGLTAGTTYDVRLFPAENVTVTDGVVSFRDTTPNNGLADAGNTPAVIEQVNGSGVVPAAWVEATPNAEGTLTFLVDSNQADAVIPVVWKDGEAAGSDDEQLDLDANDQPTEEFGVGGSKTWTPQEGDDAAALTGSITAVDKNANSFVLGTGAGARTYFYEAEDTFQLEGVQVSQARFEAELSTGDAIQATSFYDNENDADTTDEASQFNLDNLTPATPSASAARASDTSATVTITDTNDVDEYRIYRVQDEDADVDFADGDFTLVHTITDDEDAQDNTWTDTGLAPNTTYTYAVTAVLDGDESAADEDNQITTLAQGTTAAPESIDAYVQTDAPAGVFNTPDTVSNGDVWRVVFDEALAELNDGGAEVFRVQDADGNFTLVDCNTSSGGAGESEATCSLNDGTVSIDGVEYGNNEVLTVNIGATVTVGGTGNGVLDYPVSVTQATGFEDLDADNAQWVPEGDADVAIDEEGTKTEGGTGSFADAAPDATVTATTTNATVQFTEAVTGLDCTDITITNAADADADGTTNPACASITQVDADTYTVVYGGGEPVATGDTVTVAQNAVTDAGGTQGPTAARSDVV